MIDRVIDLSMKMGTSGLVLFVCLASLLVGLSSAKDCPKHKGCKATCSGKQVDLSSIVKSGFKNVTGDDTSYSYLMNFCEGVSCGDNIGTVVVCQQKNDGSNRAFSLGTLNSAQWVEADNGFNVTFSATTDSLRIAIIQFTFGKGNSISFVEELPGSSNTYLFTGVISPTSSNIDLAVLALVAVTSLIVVAVTAFAIYFIAGTLFMHFVRGARGINMIPNVNFWKSLLSPIKDGCLFVISPCRTKTTKRNEYEKI